MLSKFIHVTACVKISLLFKAAHYSILCVCVCVCVFIKIDLPIHLSVDAWVASVF
jgi:hypothetical protein